MTENAVVEGGTMNYEQLVNSSVFIPGRGFSFPGIREWLFSFPVARE